jgi:HPt (histidine-containing phosphotransfer) domain-containing protein
MDDYVSKPVSPQALAIVLDRLLPKAGILHSARAEESGRAAASVAQHETPVFDVEGLMGRLMDDEELMQKVIASFLLDTPRQIAALHEYLKTRDVAGVRRQAHTLSGASANVGGEALRVVAMGMEKAAIGADPRGCRSPHGRVASAVRDPARGDGKKNLASNPSVQQLRFP